MSNQFYNLVSLFSCIVVYVTAFICGLEDFYTNSFAVLPFTFIIGIIVFETMRNQIDSRKEEFEGHETTEDGCLERPKLLEIVLKWYKLFKESFFVKIASAPLSYITKNTLPFCTSCFILINCRILSTHMSLEMEVYQNDLYQGYIKNITGTQAIILEAVGVTELNLNSCDYKPEIFHSILCIVIITIGEAYATVMKQRIMMNCFFGESYLASNSHFLAMGFDLLWNREMKHFEMALIYMTLTFLLTLRLRVYHHNLFYALVHSKTVCYLITGIVLWRFWYLVFYRPNQKKIQRYNRRRGTAAQNTVTESTASPFTREIWVLAEF